MGVSNYGYHPRFIGPGYRTYGMPPMVGEGKLMDFLSTNGNKLARVTYDVITNPAVSAAWDLYRTFASDTVKEIASNVLSEPVVELVEDTAKAVAKMVHKKYDTPEAVSVEVSKEVIKSVIDASRPTPGYYTGHGLNPASQAALSELLAADFHGSSIAAKKRRARAKK